MHGRFMFCSDDRLSASEPAAFYFLFTTKRMDIPLRVLSYFTFGRQSKKLTLSLSYKHTYHTDFGELLKTKEQRCMFA